MRQSNRAPDVRVKCFSFPFFHPDSNAFIPQIVINLLICDTDTKLETEQCTKHYPPGTNAETGIHLKTKKINTKLQLL